MYQKPPRRAGSAAARGQASGRHQRDNRATRSFLIERGLENTRDALTAGRRMTKDREYLLDLDAIPIIVGQRPLGERSPPDRFEPRGDPENLSRRMIHRNS